MKRSLPNKQKALTKITRKKIAEPYSTEMVEDHNKPYSRSSILVIKENTDDRKTLDIYWRNSQVRTTGKLEVFDSLSTLARLDIEQTIENIQASDKSLESLIRLHPKNAPSKDALELERLRTFHNEVRKLTLGIKTGKGGHIAAKSCPADIKNQLSKLI